MKKLILSLFVLVFVAFNALAQDRTVTGTVTGDGNLPVPGASVKAAGATGGTVTDENGKYTIKVSASTSSLTFSYLGMVTQTKSIPSTNVLNALLVSDSQTLSTVVVTGLGRSTQAAAIGYSVGSVSEKNLSYAKNTDVSTALAGKIAGVQLIGSPSSTFGNADIVVRGVKGLGLSSPLFVVDGTPTAQENVVMDNVENISVLKGAAATAVWGNRGQNGVVLVTSKKGARGSKPTIDVNLGGNIENMSLLPGYQNGYAGGYSSSGDTPASVGTAANGEYKFAYNPAIHPASYAAFNGQTIIDYGADESWGPSIAGQQYRPYYSWYPGAEFGVQSPMVAQPDAINSFFQNGRTFNNSIAFSGGTEGFNFRLTYANQNRTLIIPGSQRDNNQLGISANYDISQKFTVSTDFNYRRVKTDRLPQEGYRNDGLNVTQNFNQWWQRQIDMDRLKQYRNADGTLSSWNIGDPNSGGNFLVPQYWDSPYFVVENNYGMSRGNNVFGNLGLNYKITDWLNFDNRVRLNYGESSGDFRIATGGLQQDSFSISSSNDTEFNFESNLNARKSFGDFSVDAGVGVNLRTNRSRSLSMATQGGLTFPNYFSIAGSIARPTTSNGYSAREVRSILGRASVGYKGIIYVDATIRNDWSSALPVSDNSYMYPSVSTSFVFTELMKDAAFTKYLTFGKLRASYAQVGSDLGFNSVNIQASTGSIFNTSASANIDNQLRSGAIKPALTKSFEVGAELKFFNRLGLDVAYYQDDNINQILSLTIAGASGFSSQQINAGNIQSSGIEVALTGSPVKSSTFTWDMGLNFARNRSIVKELNENQKVVIAATTWNNTQLENREGKEWGMIVGRQWNRNANGQVIVGSNGVPTFSTNVDKGSFLPAYTGGFFNSFGYKGIDLSFSIDFQKDGQFFSSTRQFNMGTGLSEFTVGVNDKGNDYRAFPGSYTLAGGNTGTGGIKIANAAFASGVANNRYIPARNYFYTALQGDASSWITNSSYIKLREVRLGYQLPKTFLGNAPVKAVNLGFVVGNAWLISAPAKKYGIDPSELESSWTEGGQLGSIRNFGLNIRASF